MCIPTIFQPRKRLLKAAAKQLSTKPKFESPNLDEHLPLLKGAPHPQNKLQPTLLDELKQIGKQQQKINEGSIKENGFIVEPSNEEKYFIFEFSDTVYAIKTDKHFTIIEDKQASVIRLTSTFDFINLLSPSRNNPLEESQFKICCIL